jgi:hypothetical protein
VILERLGLELHPEKTRRVDLYDGKEGFDFLGCHLHKRLSGAIWERERRRLYFLHRWPSVRSMKRIRQKVRDLTPGWRCHADLREVIADLNSVLSGWGNYFRTGNAARRFNQVDEYVWRRLLKLRVAAEGAAPACRRGDTLVAGLLRPPGTAPSARHCEVPGDRTKPRTRETTGKPCAGNPHARFERGS